MANKGQEIKIKSYYQSLRDKNFIDTNFMCKLGMEFFLSMLLFKGDLSRVLYSKEDIAFRRRIETVGKGDIKGKKLSYMTLNLPFGIYSQETTIEEDDRGSTQNAYQIVKGFTDPDTGITIKGAAVKVGYTSTIFFSNLDDINVAAQLLYFEKTPKAPLYFVVENDVCGTPVDIPVFITLDQMDTDPQYNAEGKQFLKESKILPVKLKFTIRTYQILIEDIDGIIKLPLRFSGLYAYNDEEVVFTQKTSLIWANSKFGSESHVATLGSDGKLRYENDNDLMLDRLKGLTENFKHEETQESNSPILKNDGLTEKEVLDDIIADTVSGYFSDNRDCTLLEYHQVEDETSEEYATVEWKVRPEEEPNFSKIVFYIPGVCNSEVNDIFINKFKIDDLYPGSSYKCTIILYSKNDSKLTYSLTINTKGEKAIKKLSDKLVGRTFTGI